jgi:M6 family metalloprotease-like protein
MKFTLRIPLIVLTVCLIAGPATVTGSAAPAAEPTSISGLLGITWADSPQGEGLPPRFDLYDADGNAFLLSLDDAVIEAAGGLHVLDGAQVTVEGEFDLGALDQSGNPAFTVSRIIPTGEASALTSVLGSKPWVIVMCKFAGNSSEPHNQAFFQGLFGSAFPGINDYWKRVSYGNVNLDGTMVMPYWVTLPHERSYYVGSSANLQALTNDCTGLVDASVNFAQFTGVSMMFNGELDGYAWGGSTGLNRDGIGIIRATWSPPWGYANQNILAHEVGHGFGLTHSSGPYDQTYDSPWDVMSSWPPCNGHSDPNYGCIGVETISYHRNLLGWVPSNRIFTAIAGTNQDITLERLGQPTNGAGTYLMAIIPIQGSNTRFYTVESRKYIDAVDYTDYEEEIMGQAVVIHLVDTTRTGRTAQVVDGDNDGDPKDAGTMWTAGETFNDAANEIHVEVLTANATGYAINIQTEGVANDNFSAARTVGSYPFSANLDTPGATTQVADPVFACADGQGVSSVWYKLTPATRGRLQISTVGSNYDTLLGLWTGSWGSLTSTACDDDSGGNGASSMSATVYANTTYYIEVAGNSDAGNLNFNLSFTACHRLSRSATLSGIVTASPAPNCGNSFYTNGTSVHLAATPATDTVFSAWSGAVTGSNNPASIVMSGTRSVTASFVPAAPTLLSPIAGATASTLRPPLDWSDISGATYSLQYSRNSNFSSATTLTTSTSAGRPTSDLLPNAIYYWRVRSKISGVSGPWSSRASFRSPNPPSVPTLLTPANGATTTGLQPTLDWSTSSNYPAGYQVQVSTTNVFTSPVLDASVTTSAYTLPAGLPAGTYFWRVRAFNAASQYSRWSTVYKFTIPGG